MKVFLGTDHRGFELKELLRQWLEEQGHTVTDCGAKTLDTNDDYPDYAFAVAKHVAQDPTARGILLCGSGAGVAVAANKQPGIRAVLIHNENMAQAARNDDDINILALGADFITLGQATPIITAFLQTPFQGEDRQVRRLKKIDSYHPSL